MSMTHLADTAPRIEMITFDCYGTLLDWRRGIGTVLQNHVERAGRSWSTTIFDDYVRNEARIEAGPYKPYRDILTAAEQATMAALDIDVTTPCLATSVADWPPFPDTVAGLRRLQQRYRLGVLSNIDRDLFEASFGRLGIDLDLLVTADEVRSYKPETPHFDAMLERSGLPREAVLHAAQSRFHDIAACNRLDIACVWINRYDEPDMGPAQPLATLPDIASLADALMGRA